MPKDDKEVAMKRSEDDVWGRELDWLAIDSEGHVAFFSTAGGGYPPEAFLEDTESHDAAIDVLLVMPPCTGVRFAPEMGPEDENTWRLAAERGLFAFDSDPNGGPYVLRAAPIEPATSASLPGSVASVANRIYFPHLRFAELLTIGEDLLKPQP
ncbi:MAG: hypothetical protein R3F14_00045 [Polyangiaceae bacterium]